MIVGVVKESFPGEARVAMVPGLVPQLAKAGIEVMIESGAGTAAGFLDEEYTAKGAKVVGGRREVYEGADVIAIGELLDYLNPVKLREPDEQDEEIEYTRIVDRPEYQQLMFPFAQEP